MKRIIVPLIFMTIMLGFLYWAYGFGLRWQMGLVVSLIYLLFLVIQVVKIGRQKREQGPEEDVV